MKSVVKFGCIFILILGLFNGCTSENPYQVQICGFSDSDTGVSLDYEYSYWNDPIDESDVEPTLTANIDGKEISGVYNYGFRAGPNNYAEYTYKDSENNRFTVDENGGITRFTRGGSISSSNELPVKNRENEDKCLKKAIEFLQNYINTADYQFRKADYVTSPECYCFEFQKNVCGFPTTDGGNITISTSGELLRFNFFMLGQIPMDTRVPFDIKKAKKCITQKLDLLYAEQHSKYSSIKYEFHEDEFVITILETGEIAMICDVSVSCHLPVNDGNMIIGERISFVITNEEFS